jgi:hypothetical protein
MIGHGKFEIFDKAPLATGVEILVRILSMNFAGGAGSDFLRYLADDVGSFLGMIFYIFLPSLSQVKEMTLDGIRA